MELELIPCSSKPQLTNHMILNHVIIGLSGMTSPYPEPLHFWDKSPLVMLCYLFSVLLDSVCLYFFFLKTFVSLFIKDTHYSFLVISLSSFGVRRVIPHRKHWEVFPPFLCFGGLEDWCLLFCKCLVVFTSEAIWS